MTLLSIVGTINRMGLTCTVCGVTFKNVLEVAVSC